MSLIRLRPLVLLLLAAITAPFASAAAGAGAEGQTVYVMRHLPPDSGEDPGLSPAGAVQARALAKKLGRAKIKAMFVTDTRRSRETAAPLAGKLRLSPSIYDPFKPELLVAAVRSVAGNVLVVGHSNTVHDLVARFGGKAPAPLAHGDFGTVWKVSGEQTTSFAVKPQSTR